MIRRLVSAQSKSITGAAILLGSASLVSRLVGMLRDRLFAHYFGAGDILDAYYAAFRIPDFIYNLLIVGAISAGFIPIFLIVWQRKKDEAWRLTSAVINLLGLAVMGLCIVLWLLTPRLMPWLTPGFHGDKLKLAAMLTRVMLVSPFILGLSAIVSGVLQAMKSFLIYSLAPIFYNLGIILGTLILVPRFGPIGLGLGVALGALLHLGIQLPTFFGFGFRYAPVFLWHNRDLWQIGRQIVPRTLSLATSQVNLLIITTIASTLAAGSITIFNFANNLQYVPVGLIGISFAIAAFPTLAGFAAEKNLPDLVSHLAHTIRQILFFILPLTIIFLLLRAQIVRVVLGSGAFDWTATIATANALAFFSLSLTTQCVIPLLTRTFFALQDTWTPFLIGVITELTNLVGCLIFKSWLGVLGLALAFSIAMTVQAALLYISLRRKIGNIEEARLLHYLYKISLAALIMAVTIQALKFPVAHVVNMNKFWGIFAHGLVLGSAGAIIYIIICTFLRVEEMSELKATLTRRWLRLRHVQGEIVDGDSA